ncbi:MAG: DapH/DapD/GlmU-related protein [Steroidobacteraceae bacterium]
MSHQTSTDALADGVFVGPFVEIQRGGRSALGRAFNLTLLSGELVVIGEDCFIGHGVKFVNDTFSTGGPAKGRRELWRSTVIGRRVSIGSNATILPVSICDDVVIGAGSVVTKNIVESGIYAGNPARKLRSHTEFQTLTTSDAKLIKVPFADLYSQYLKIQPEIDAAISQVIRESAFIRGHFVDEFEADFAQAIGAKNCVSCANGMMRST